MTSAVAPEHNVNGVSPPPPPPPEEGGGDEQDVSHEMTMHLAVLYMLRQHPKVVQTVRLMRGDPLEDIYTPEELEALNDQHLTFWLFVALLISLYVANG